jgi:hypothetical protein
LGGCGVAHLEILGLNMVVSGQNVSVKPTCQSNDKPKRARKGKVAVPDSWKLTPQQQNFIDSFSADNDKKE